MPARHRSPKVRAICSRSGLRRYSSGVRSPSKWTRGERKPRMCFKRPIVKRLRPPKLLPLRALAPHSTYVRKFPVVILRLSSSQKIIAGVMPAIKWQRSLSLFARIFSSLEISRALLVYDVKISQLGSKNLAV
jgi:hypothetical protein